MKNLLKRTPILYDLFNFIRKRISLYKNILRVKREIKKVDFIRVVIGASSVYEHQWIPTDMQYLNLLNRSDWENFFWSRKIDTILCEHVWEHLTIEEGIEAAEICYEYLKPGGYIRVAVPDGLHPNKAYVDSVKIGGTGSGADDHKVLYTYKTLLDVFNKAGFQVDLLEYFDEGHQFHYYDWDIQDGMIHRSRRYDPRNIEEELIYTSIIIDAKKALV